MTPIQVDSAIAALHDAVVKAQEDGAEEFVLERVHEAAFAMRYQRPHTRELTERARFYRALASEKMGDVMRLADMTNSGPAECRFASAVLYERAACILEDLVKGARL